MEIIAQRPINVFKTVICLNFIQMDSINESIYEAYLSKIKPPQQSQTIWKIPNKNRLGICFIEFREQKFLEHVLNQVAKVYGGTDVSLYIIHGTKNKSFFEKIMRNWENVQYIEYPYENIDRTKYNEICCDSNLYEQFNTKFILKMEWDSFIRKQIPDMFFNYSYVGAPWKGYPNDYPDNPHIRVGNKLVGNGGFSLRKVDRMIEICKNNPLPLILCDKNDVHITNCLNDSEVPLVEIAKRFSVEWVHDEDPVGLHQVWIIYPIHVFSKWMECIE
jgi:hypothetical protein